MSPGRYWAAAIAFHVIGLMAVWWTARRWVAPTCASPLASWCRRLARQALALAVLAYAASLLVTIGANLDEIPRLRVGPITGRLMGQALFGEAILFAFLMARRHRCARATRRSLALASVGVVLLGVYAEAYRIEPQQVRVRHHVVDRTGGGAVSRTLRILHVSDLQTPTIGPREEAALVKGLSFRPDLIVLTGDYVQDALGRPTEAQAAGDLRALVARIAFRAPYGAFATEGDVGPRCREVFKETAVRCLVDESASVVIPGVGTLVVTGLSRGGGRSRDAAWLSHVMRSEETADRHIVISHAPDFVDSVRDRIDLALAGHTHGGQVALPLVGPLKTASRLPRRYAGGLNEYDGIPLHVTRGVGMERGFDPPVRFLCPPEICILDVLFAPRSHP